MTEKISNGIELLQNILDMELKTTTVQCKVVRLLNEHTLLLKHNEQSIPMALGKEAQKDLIRLAGMTQESVQILKDNLGASAGVKIIEKVIEGLGKRKDSLVLLRVGAQIQKIALESERSKVVPKEKMASIIRHFLETDENLILGNVYIHPEEGAFSVRLYNNNKHILPIPGEDVATGVSIHWQFDKPVEVREYVLRLVCSNGMVGDRVRNTTKLTAQHTAQQWYAAIMDPEKQDHLLQKYTGYVAQAMKVNLSVAEFNQIKGHCLRYYPDNLAEIAKELGDEMWKLEYESLKKNPNSPLFGKELDDLTPEQQANCPTPVNAWKAVNLLTWLASNSWKAGIRDNVRDKTQFFAGRILSQEWDGSAFMFDVPRFDSPTYSGPRFNEVEIMNVGDFDAYDAAQEEE